MVQSPLPGFDLGRLERQQKFLLDRANSHSRAKAENLREHQAAAASFIRDAAALALIKGDATEAAELFMRAGRIFADLGVLYGFQLMVLSDPESFVNWFLEQSDYAKDVILFLRHEGVERSARVAEAPYLKASADSPRQLLCFYEAVLSSPSLWPEDAGFAEMARVRLQRVPGFPVGPTGTPLVQYLEVLDEVSNSTRAPLTPVSGTAQEVLQTMVSRRAEQIALGRRDKVQWSMLLNPADLIDIDLLTTSTIAAQHRRSLQNIFASKIAEPSLLDFPIRSASMLRNREGFGSGFQ